jgi:hypothetical protein
VGEEKGEARFARAIVPGDAPGALSRFLVQAGGDSVQVLLDLAGNDIAVQGGWVAEVALQVRGSKKPALDVEKVCDFGIGHKLAISINVFQ